MKILKIDLIFLLRGGKIENPIARATVATLAIASGFLALVFAVIAIAVCLKLLFKLLSVLLGLFSLLFSLLGLLVFLHFLLVGLGRRGFVQHKSTRTRSTTTITISWDAFLKAATKP